MDDLKYEAMDDDDVRHYLPDARILKYNELVKYKTLESLLPKHKSYVILLFPLQVKRVVIGLRLLGLITPLNIQTVTEIDPMYHSLGVHPSSKITNDI